MKTINSEREVVLKSDFTIQDIFKTYHKAYKEALECIPPKVDKYQEEINKILREMYVQLNSGDMSITTVSTKWQQYIKDIQNRKFIEDSVLTQARRIDEVIRNINISVNYMPQDIVDINIGSIKHRRVLLKRYDELYKIHQLFIDYYGFKVEDVINYLMKDNIISYEQKSLREKMDTYLNKIQLI